MTPSIKADRQAARDRVAVMRREQQTTVVFTGSADGLARSWFGAGKDD